MLRPALLLALTFAATQPAAAQTAPALPPLPAAEPVVLVGTYWLTYRPDSTDADTRTELLDLELGKTSSRFQSRGQHLMDSATAAMTAAPVSQDNVQGYVDKMMALPRSRFHYSIYKTGGGRQVAYFDKIGLNSFRYDEPADALAWTLAPAAAPETIAGYACQRATASFGGRQWTAWFARAVPVPDGPYKFGGLPGLILKVADARGHYVFELLKLGPPAAARQLALPAKAAKATTKAVFRRAQAAFDADPLAAINASAPGGTRVIVANPEQAQQAARLQARKNNNPLELK